MTDPLHTVRPRRGHPWWRILAWSLAILLLVSGLAALAVWVVAVSAVNSYGSNK
jgi:hypothetical protein